MQFISYDYQIKRLLAPYEPNEGLYTWCGRYLNLFLFSTDIHTPL